MTDLDLYTGLPKTPDPTGGRLVAWAGAAVAAHQLASSLSKTSFVPRAFQGNAGDATAAIMLGDELGLSPIAALRSIYIISGTPALYARTMVALAMAHGHSIWTEESSDRQVTVCGRRRGEENVEQATWTIDRARKAGYTNNKKYDTDPQAMLYSKAAAEIARKIAPDVLSGVPYSVEDLELENPPTAAVKRTASTRVQRRQEPPSAPEPSFDEPEVTTVQPDVTDTPEGITAAQSKKLHAALRDNDLDDRDAALAYISGVIGRDITSSKELSKAEASQVIDSLDVPPAPETEPTLDGLS